MGKEYKFEGETFFVDNSKGCYLEVSYQGLVGYVGVWVAGTPEGPFGWSTSRSAVTDEGLRGGNLGIARIESSLDGLCANLLRQYQQEVGRRSFKPDEACQAIHDFAEKL